MKINISGNFSDFANNDDKIVEQTIQEQIKVKEQLVREWYLTILHDLCLPIIELRFAPCAGYGTSTYGEYSPEHDTITIPLTIPLENLIPVLAHECRHAWQTHNKIAATESDAEKYANEFLDRCPKPNCGFYDGYCFNWWEKADPQIEARKRLKTMELAKAQSQHRWYGQMQCSACGYEWESRRDTPPSSCPQCRNRNISVLLEEKEHRIRLPFILLAIIGIIVFIALARFN